MESRHSTTFWCAALPDLRCADGPTAGGREGARRQRVEEALGQSEVPTIGLIAISREYA